MPERSRDFNWLGEDPRPGEIGDAIWTKFRDSNWDYSKWVDGELPKVEWPPAIKTSEPLVIYRDGLNAVIMISNESGIERGYYVQMPNSSQVIMFDSLEEESLSYRSEGEDEWVFKHIEDSVYAYTRTKANKSE